MSEHLKDRAEKKKDAHKQMKIWVVKILEEIHNKI